MNYGKFFSLLKAANEKGHLINRKDLIYGFTEGRTESLKEVSPSELREMEMHLQQLVHSDQDKADKMRKKVISVFHHLNIRDEKGRVKMEAVNAWCKKYGYLHKPLNDYTVSELPRLVTQAEKYEKSVL